MLIAPHIAMHPDVADVPVIAGTGIAVSRVVALVGEGLRPRDIRALLQVKPRGLLTDDAVAAAVAYARDSYCTPKEIADLLPVHDWDPCSNPYSHIRALSKCSLETGTDGLQVEWDGLVFANVPFSNPLAWAEKLAASPRVKLAAFLVNVDSSTRWFRKLTEQLDTIFFFNERIQFEPFPGVKQTTNNKPQAIIAHGRYFQACDSKLFELGQIYERRAA